MARKRYGGPGPRLIWPATVTSPQIRQLAKDPLHLLVWYALFHGLDDQGRMEARVSVIQTLCLRHVSEEVLTPEVIRKALGRMRSLLDENGIPLVYTYKYKDILLLQVAKWWDWQYAMTNAYPSRWPPMIGWEDRFLGHGKAAFDELLADPETPSGALWGDDGATTGERKPTRRSPSRARVDTNTNTNTNTDTTKGHLVDAPPIKAVLDLLCTEQGVDWRTYPGLPIQARHAKLLLAEGATIDSLREAMQTIKANPYWANRGWNLATLRANWGELLTQGRAPSKRKSSGAKPIEDGVILND